MGLPLYLVKNLGWANSCALLSYLETKGWTSCCCVKVFLISRANCASLIYMVMEVSSISFWKPWIFFAFDYVQCPHIPTRGTERTSIMGQKEVVGPWCQLPHCSLSQPRRVCLRLFRCYWDNRVIWKNHPLWCNHFVLFWGHCLPQASACQMWFCWLLTQPHHHKQLRKEKKTPTTNNKWGLHLHKTNICDGPNKKQ